MSEQSMMVCGHCGAECGPSEDWSEEDARREAEENFVGILDAPGDERGVLCDDCFKEFIPWMEANYGPGPWPHIP